MYFLPSISLPKNVLLISYSSILTSVMNSSKRVFPTTHVSPSTSTSTYSSFGLTPTIASVTSVNGIVVHTIKNFSSSASFTL